MKPGDLVSHYRIVQKIGEGGMGEVFIAQDETLKRRVALKSLRATQKLRTDAHTRFAREARVLSQLDHPHICRVFDYISTEAGDSIVLELIEGRPLTRLDRSLTYAQKLQIGEQIASALVAAHAEGIVHRDLKPGNLMLTPSGGVKVLDFGLACVANSDEPITDPEPPPEQDSAVRDWITSDESISGFHTEYGRVFGTVQYMAPEQAESGAVVGSAADMFSFGLVLQELFTGNAARRIAKQDGLDRVAEGASSPVEGLPGDLTDLITRLKERAPTRRPTAVETLKRLQWIRAKPQRRLRAVMVSALVLIAVGGVTKYTLDLMAQRAETENKRRDVEAMNAFLLGEQYDLLDSVQLTEGFEASLKRVLDYYTAIPADALLPDQIENYARAWILRGTVRLEKDNVDVAFQAFDAALKLLESQPAAHVDECSKACLQRQALFEIGVIHRMRGEPEQAENAFRAVAELTRAPGGEWKDDKLSSGAWQGRVERQLGQILLARGRRDEARLKLLGAEQCFEGIPSPTTEEQYEHALVEAAIGNWHSERMEYEEAEAPLTRQLEISLRLAAEQPSNKRWQIEVANGYTNLGSLERHQEDYEGARAAFKRSIETWRALVLHDPANSAWKNALADVLSWLSTAEQRLWHVGAALEPLREEHQIRDALTKQDPANLEWLRRRTICENNTGACLEALDKTAEASQWFREALEHSRKLAEAEPTNMDWKLDQVVYLRRLALSLIDLGDHRRAQEHLDEAVNILKTEPTSASPRKDWILALARCRIGLGELKVARSELELAAIELDHARGLLDHRVLSGAQEQPVKDVLASFHIMQACLQERRGNVVDAQREAQSGYGLLEKDIWKSFTGRRVRLFAIATRIAHGQDALVALLDKFRERGYDPPAYMQLSGGN